MSSAVNYIFLASCVALGGCAINQNIVDPSTVTLEQALVDTVDALAAARERSIEKKTNFAFYGCTVTAQFNVSATQTVGTKLALSATGGPPAAIAPVSINLSGSRETSDSGTRGNTVTVVLATPGCIPNTKTLGASSPVMKTAAQAGQSRAATRPSKGSEEREAGGGGGGSGFGKVIMQRQPNY